MGLWRRLTPTSFRENSFPWSEWYDTIQVPAIVVFEIPGPDSHTPEWIKGLVEAALQWPTRTSQHPADQYPVVYILRDALRYAQESQGLIPQAHIDHIYDPQLRTSYDSESTNTGLPFLGCWYEEWE